MGAVVSALRVANEHLNPIPDQNIIKVPIPKYVHQLYPCCQALPRFWPQMIHGMFCRMTKELRERLVKLAKVNAEKAKVGIRKARQKGVSDVRKRKGTVSEDSIYRIEKHVSYQVFGQTGMHALIIFLVHADPTNDRQPYKNC